MMSRHTSHLKSRYFNVDNLSEALKAADEILIGQREKDNAKALGVKAEAMYNLGNFEHALLCFHRALKTANMKVCHNSYKNFNKQSVIKVIISQ